VRIDLHHQLLAWRGELLRRGLVAPGKRWALAIGGAVLRHPWLYECLGRLARAVGRRLPRAWLYARANVWGRARELPDVPPRSFRDWHRERRDV
jgi:L-lactate dehydrogenase complex protein LldF